MQDLLGSLPPNVSTYGADIDFLYHLCLYITTIAFVLVQAALIFFLWRYRASASARATYTHGNTRLEMIWTTVPAVILVLLGFLSRGTWNHIKRFMPPADVIIKVTGKQFNWEILYSGPDGKFGTPDDYQVDNDLRVPVNKVVRILLNSHDVIHSFFIPQARLKQDALPGREIPAWFEITKTGEYEIPCAELCGFGHSGMKGTLKVLSEGDYAAWLKEQWPPAGTPTPQDSAPTASGSGTIGRPAETAAETAKQPGYAALAGDPASVAHVPRPTRDGEGVPAAPGAVAPAGSRSVQDRTSSVYGTPASASPASSAAAARVGTGDASPGPASSGASAPTATPSAAPTAAPALSSTNTVHSLRRSGLKERMMRSIDPGVFEMRNASIETV